MAIGTSAGLSMADPFPAPNDEDLFMLGPVHMVCIQRARGRIRHGNIQFDEYLPLVAIDTPSEDDPNLRVDLPASPESCPFCGPDDSDMTDEDIYPMWLLRDLHRRGVRRLDGHPTRRLVGPTTPVCATCNNTWMSVIENDTKDLLLSLIDHTRGVRPEEQLQLATWATMKAILFERLLPTKSVPRAFSEDLRISRRPPPGVSVWIGAYSGPGGRLQAILWPIYAEDDDTIQALCVTFTGVSLVFQVLIAFDYGTLSPLETFHDSVKMIYPNPMPTFAWPPGLCFDESSIEALSCRIFNNREPVVMEVVMQPTRVTKLGPR
jgi:hypothetical protein